MMQRSTMQRLTQRDRQWLDAVRQQAAELGRLPSKQELPNYELLQKRFGNWPNIMVCAGLKQSKTVRRAQNRERDQRCAQRRMAMLENDRK